MTQITPPNVPIPKEVFAEKRLAALRGLTLEERANLLESACKSAEDLLEARRAAGLPEVVRAPWPASTFELLKKFASAYARSAECS
jgi:hypothetical protein